MGLRPCVIGAAMDYGHLGDVLKVPQRVIRRLRGTGIAGILNAMAAPKMFERPMCSKPTFMGRRIQRAHDRKTDAKRGVTT